MAKGFIAIDPNKTVRQLTQQGLFTLRRLHQAQKVDGWQYGKAEDLQDLLSKVITKADTSKVLSENEALKAKIAELEKAMSTQVDEISNDEETLVVKQKRTRKSVNTEI